LTTACPRATIPSDGIACDGILLPGITVADDRPSSPLSTQVFQILLSLVDDDLHGYAIIQDVAARTEGEVRLTASTLYAAIKRLLETGWIEEVRRRPSVDDDARNARRARFRSRIPGALRRAARSVSARGS
jgi:hypothetical protein